MTTITSAEELRGLLETLGGNPDEIAATLRAAGITGTPKCTGRCPIARWLIVKAGGWDVSVDSDDVILRTETGAYACTMPPAAGYFVTYFDAGFYPELVSAAVSA
jgi:hypothetical protein